jgi:hypothetical protein
MWPLASAGDTGAVLDANDRAELERLRRDNAELRLDRAFLKIRGLPRLRAQPVEAYRVIEAEEATYPIKRVTRGNFGIPSHPPVGEVVYSRRGVVLQAAQRD